MMTMPEGYDAYKLTSPYEDECDNDCHDCAKQDDCPDAFADEQNPNEEDDER